MASLRAENEALRQRLAEFEDANSTQDVVGRARVARRTTDSDVDEAGGKGIVAEDSENVCGKAGLTVAQIARYSRHLLVPAVGVTGQR